MSSVTATECSVQHCTTTDEAVLSFDGAGSSVVVYSMIEMSIFFC